MVLVVEDNLLNQKVIVNLLRRQNLSCDLAGNGDDAIDMYTSDPARYAMILMDIYMPIKDGLTATREIRVFEEENGIKTIPIIALSAQVMDQDRDACIKAGMDAFLEKPVRFMNLCKILDPIFSGYPSYENTTPSPNINNVNAGISINNYKQHNSPNINNHTNNTAVNTIATSPTTTTFINNYQTT